jgi:hypothetical protein
MSYFHYSLHKCAFAYDSNKYSLMRQSAILFQDKVDSFLAEYLILQLLAKENSSRGILGRTVHPHCEF